MEELSVTAACAWIDELIDPKKATWQFMSESEGEYSYDHSSDELKEALFDMVAVNDLAESDIASMAAMAMFWNINYCVVALQSLF